MNPLRASPILIVLLSFTAAFRSSSEQRFVTTPYIVAQSDYSGQNGNVGGTTRGFPFAQTFTPISGGELFSISAGFYAPQTSLDPYFIYQFRDTTSSGAPSTTVITSVNVPTDFLSLAPTPYGYGWVDLTADFSAFGIALTPGHTYAFSVDLPGPVGTTIQNSFFWGLTGSGYAGGDPYYFTTGEPQLLNVPNEDFLFKITAVPEPSIFPIALVVSALALRKCLIESSSG